ncbi:MAG: glycosyl hydrolase family 28-related protein [Prolixibacteraceae bacterium]
MKKPMLFPYKAKRFASNFFLPLITGTVMLLSGCERLSGLFDGSTEDPPVAGEPVIDVKSAGAKGDGTTDDTWAFQKAIDSVAILGGGTVYVPQGIYLVDPDTAVCIKMKSNVVLDMVDTTRVLLAKANSLLRYNVIQMKNISDARVLGGKIIGDRNSHTGTTGEWGMGIAIYGCTNAWVKGTKIINCWGDGISIAAKGISNPSRNCVIKQVICDNNRRQGLSIGGVDSLIVDSCTFIRTNGTAPQDGIDIEPDKGTAQRVYITNCEIAHNARQGVEMLAKTTTTAVVTNIYVQNNYIHHNVHSGYVRQVSNVVFTNNRMTNNKYLNNRVNVKNATNSIFDPNTYE